MAEERKWDDLQTDCLINIFVRVDTGTLAESVQFVCKSWYQTTLIPQCWLNLKFTERFFSVDFVRNAIDRSKKAATSVIFSYYDPGLSNQSLLCIAQGCPLLKVLHLPSIGDDHNLISGLIPNWKNLESIKICDVKSYMEIITSISLHCKNFTQLFLSGFDIWDEEFQLICQLTPKIKVLRLFDCQFTRLGVEMILKSSSELEVFDVSECDGDDEIDGDEIQKLAPHLNYISFSGYNRYKISFGEHDGGNGSEHDEDNDGQDSEDEDYDHED